MSLPNGIHWRIPASTVGPPFSCGKIGATQEGPKELASYVADHNCAKLGKGEGTFNRENQVVPEAAYFTDMDGARGGYLVINMDDASQIPAMVEPLFLGLGATIELHSVMAAEDLEKGFPALEQAAQKYG